MYEFKYEMRAELIYVDLRALITGQVTTLVHKVFNKSIHNSCIFSLATCHYKSIVGAISDGS